MIGILVKYLIQVKTDDGSILVFLPGAPEINQAMKAIEIITRGMKVDILPLHGGLHPRDQKKVFIAASQSRTKVILATNIAETSITIPDCTYVVDSCREKQSSYDPENRMPLLLERFASKASIKQRCGRAGRVKAGSCYKLISRETYESLDEHGVPEIHRCALDQSLLSLLYMGLENGSNRFLKTLLDPPSKASVDSAIHSLKEIGAISTHQGNGRILLTPLGTHLSCIPAPPLVGKIMIMGSILGCRKASLAIAASMSLRASPFRKIDNFRQDIATLSHDVVTESIHKSRRELFYTVGNSDYAMIAAAYMLWDDAAGPKRRRYCDEMGLNIHFLQDMKQMFGQLDTSLTAAGYESTMESECNNQTWRIVRTCVVASLAPSHIVRVHRPSTKYAETIGGAKELDTEAKSLSFFIASSQPSNQLTVNEEGSELHLFENHPKVFRFPEERVFIHPCSANFFTGNFNCPWLVYYELVRTSKAFLRDATECSAYALLLFGGNLEIQAVDGKIIVAGRITLAANARIGALVGGLRKMIDELMNQKIQDPSFDVTSTAAMRLVRSLLVTDGLG
jgi:ATP-dependent RNA helicase DHX57